MIGHKSGKAFYTKLSRGCYENQHKNKSSFEIASKLDFFVRYKLLIAAYLFTVTVVISLETMTVSPDLSAIAATLLCQLS